MNNDFVEKYISDCVDNGVCNPKNICELAVARIKEINTELMNYNKLRIEKANLEGVLRSFNSEEIKRKNRKSHMIDADKSELDVSYISLLSKICDFIGSSGKNVMPREIMDHLLLSDVVPDGNVDDKQKMIYMSIKWLLDKSIINRNDEDRSIFPGNKWDERPIYTG